MFEPSTLIRWTDGRQCCLFHQSSHIVRLAPQTLSPPLPRIDSLLTSEALTRAEYGIYCSSRWAYASHAHMCRHGNLHAVVLLASKKHSVSSRLVLPRVPEAASPG